MIGRQASKKFPRDLEMKSFIDFHSLVAFPIYISCLEQTFDCFLILLYSATFSHFLRKNYWKYYCYVRTRLEDSFSGDFFASTIRSMVTHLSGFRSGLL